ncbi:hypothetical protein [sulfur-oxidizing endosymbiont of Gigantopelta aegis]|uniref:hypothetical protein n=1 Tax=sulfur-oxidizing endosymbiont of Gigantopelta aegis TaxID=2794934 RepID=UPI001BE43313|nr:hypothetical protein [sulfur-oxidizing endosymbiont of Gigantopelta aegis]
MEDEDYSRWLMKQVFNWHQDFFYNLTWDKKLKFMSMAPMELVFRNISNRFITKKRNKINSRFKTRFSMVDEASF